MELELKSMREVDGWVSCFCGPAATMLAETGEFNADHGSFFDICNADECLEMAFDVAIERINSYKKHKSDYIQEEKYDWSKIA